ncbi:MAG: ATP synthase F1 subunit delta [Candidatus Izemoplasmataceae bacterium]
MDYIAFQYAEALFQLATEKDNIDEILTDFRELVDVLDQDFYMFMEHPNMKRVQKQSLIKRIVKPLLIQHLCFVLVDNHRINLLPDVLEAYVGLINLKERVMDVDVYSKKPLSEKEMNGLVVSLEKRFSNTVRLHNTVDDRIIGGVRLEYNGAILDDTVNHYFKALQTRLTK